MKARPMIMASKLRLFVLLFLLAGFFSGEPQSLQGALLTVKVGYPQPSGAQIPLWVIPDAKLDQRYGLNVQVIYISGGARLTQTVVSGDIDMAMTGGAVV
ncbi:MAG: hypothetical protein AAB222_05980, partial [Candidatus Binatota bacterium]